jgi:hypothetical protein
VKYLRVAGLVLVVASAAVLSACGGKATGRTSPAPSARNAFAAYTSCLRDHGVNLPSANPSARPRGSVRPSRSPGPRPSDGNGGGGFGNGGGGFGGGFGGFGDQAPPGVDQDTWTKAMQACASVRPSQSARDNGAIAAYRNCLSDHGVSMQQGGFGNLDTNDPKVAAAVQACEPLRPSNLPTARPSR